MQVTPNALYMCTCTCTHDMIHVAGIMCVLVSLVEVHLYKQSSPYTSSTNEEFDSNLGPHDGFLLLGRYIFAQVSQWYYITCCIVHVPIENYWR